MTITKEEIEARRAAAMNRGNVEASKTAQLSDEQVLMIIGIYDGINSFMQNLHKSTKELSAKQLDVARKLLVKPLTAKQRTFLNAHDMGNLGLEYQYQFEVFIAGHNADLIERHARCPKCGRNGRGVEVSE